MASLPDALSLFGCAQNVNVIRINLPFTRNETRNNNVSQ